MRNKKYFAIAFPNKSGGFEVRNPYYKGCIKNKDVSVFYHTNGMTQEHICVFEGFMDFLSYMTLRKKGNTEICVDGMVDVLVMYYNDFGTWIRKQFPDFRVQKISIDADSGGCLYDVVDERYHCAVGIA